MSTAQSWLSELDQVIAVHGGVATLASSDSSSDRAVLTLRSTLQSFVEANGPEVGLPGDYGDWVPIDLPKWVPRPIAAAQHFRITSGSMTSSSRKAEVLRKRAELAAARVALAEAQLAEAEYEGSQSRASYDEVDAQADRLGRAGLGPKVQDTIQSMLPLSNFGKERDAQPETGIDQALGDSFTSRGYAADDPRPSNDPPINSVSHASPPLAASASQNNINTSNSALPHSAEAPAFSTEFAPRHECNQAPLFGQPSPLQFPDWKIFRPFRRKRQCLRSSLKHPRSDRNQCKATFLLGPLQHPREVLPERLRLLHVPRLI